MPGTQPAHSGSLEAVVRALALVCSPCIPPKAQDTEPWKEGQQAHHYQLCCDAFSDGEVTLTSLPLLP